MIEKNTVEVSKEFILKLDSFLGDQIKVPQNRRLSRDESRQTAEELHREVLKAFVEIMCPLLHASRTKASNFFTSIGRDADAERCLIGLADSELVVQFASFMAHEAERGA